MERRTRYGSNISIETTTQREAEEAKKDGRGRQKVEGKRGRYFQQGRTQ